MIKIQKNSAVSEIVGALLLVSLVITGMAIISVILLSGPPPSSGIKAIIGVKCSFCPDMNPTQYDILIGHEGGETLNTDSLQFSLIKRNGSEIIYPKNNITIFSPNDTGITPVPETCDGISGNREWSEHGTISTGESLKYSYNGSINDYPLALLIQQPSSIGFSTISQLQMKFIRNLTNTSTETGYIGLKYVAEQDLGIYPYVGNTSRISDDYCNVTFTYKNTNDYDLPFPYKSEQQSMWNYIEEVQGWETKTSWIEVDTKNVFPKNSSGVAVKITNFTGKINYNLGSYSTVDVTC